MGGWENRSIPRRHSALLLFQAAATLRNLPSLFLLLHARHPNAFKSFLTPSSIVLVQISQMPVSPNSETPPQTTDSSAESSRLCFAQEFWIIFSTGNQEKPKTPETQCVLRQCAFLLTPFPIGFNPLLILHLGPWPSDYSLH